mmetsp:Transcript_3975/g.14125  ORF Transcript_3975/g.14125 Transcript_3975/m.14125 type:complete len:243 (+) Transcript_3975:2310-3038(+)
MLTSIEILCFGKHSDQSRQQISDFCQQIGERPCSLAHKFLRMVSSLAPLFPLHTLSSLGRRPCLISFIVHILGYVIDEELLILFLFIIGEVADKLWLRRQFARLVQLLLLLSASILNSEVSSCRSATLRALLFCRLIGAVIPKTCSQLDCIPTGLVAPVAPRTGAPCAAPKASGSGSRLFYATSLIIQRWTNGCYSVRLSLFRSRVARNSLPLLIWCFSSRLLASSFPQQSSASILNYLSWL